MSLNDSIDRLQSEEHLEFFTEFFLHTILQKRPLSAKKCEKMQFQSYVTVHIKRAFWSKSVFFQETHLKIQTWISHKRVNVSRQAICQITRQSIETIFVGTRARCDRFYLTGARKRECVFKPGTFPLHVKRKKVSPLTATARGSQVRNGAKPCKIFNKYVLSTCSLFPWYFGAYSWFLEFSVNYNSPKLGLKFFFRFFKVTVTPRNQALSQNRFFGPEGPLNLDFFTLQRSFLENGMKEKFCKKFHVFLWLRPIDWVT